MELPSSGMDIVWGIVCLKLAAFWKMLPCRVLQISICPRVCKKEIIHILRSCGCSRELRMPKDVGRVRASLT